MGLMSDDRFNQIVEAIRQNGVEFDTPMKSIAGFSIGDKVVAIVDDDENGIYEGEFGIVIPMQVGAKKYGNIQTKLYVCWEGCDVGTDAQYPQLEFIEEYMGWLPL